MSPREFNALKSVYDGHLYRWASEQAAFYNVHFRAKGSAPWEPEHFLGKKRYGQQTFEGVRMIADMMRNPAEVKLTGVFAELFENRRKQAARGQ